MSPEQQVPAPYKTIIYREGSQYFARDSLGNLLLSLTPPDDIGGITLPFPNPGNDPFPLLQAALNRQGDIYVAGGDYHFTNSFEGLRLSNLTRLRIAQDTTFFVPDGYSGSVFILEGVNGVEIDGGFYREAGRPLMVNREWTLFEMIGREGGNGAYSNHIQNIQCWFAGEVIRLRTASPEGWVHANRFSNFIVWGYRRGIVFSSSGSYNENFFENLMFQTHGLPLVQSQSGVRRVRGRSNVFLNVTFYDAVANGVERLTGNVARITNEATSTLIIGGIMTHPADKFVDNGVDTQIIDPRNVIVTA